MAVAVAEWRTQDADVSRVLGVFFSFLLFFLLSFITGELLLWEP